MIEYLLRLGLISDDQAVLIDRQPGHPLVDKQSCTEESIDISTRGYDFVIKLVHDIFAGYRTCSFPIRNPMITFIHFNCIFFNCINFNLRQF